MQWDRALQPSVLVIIQSQKPNQELVKIYTIHNREPRLNHESVSCNREGGTAARFHFWIFFFVWKDNIHVFKLLSMIFQTVGVRNVSTT